MTAGMKAKVFKFPGGLFCGECGRALQGQWGSELNVGWHKADHPVAHMVCVDYHCRLYQHVFEIPAQTLQVAVHPPRYP